MKRIKRHIHLTTMHWLVAVALAMCASACAKIGRPEGGPRDVLPPAFVYANPAPGATNVNRQQIDLYFNENVQLEDAFNKVVVSPVQKNVARVSSNGRHVKVMLQDTLLPNTTYTIDFADAIKDLNEGNILDGFATYFSTGDDIDTLCISGIVLDARTLEPQQGVLVGVYSNLADTAIRTLPMERIARTNQLGQFTLLNLKEGEYRIYALNDVNRDHHWDRSEDVAYYDVTVKPYVQAITVTDTLRSATDEDSLVSRAGYAYYPNDVLLTTFNEGYTAQYLKDYKRNDRRTLSLNMATAADSLPQITIARGPLEGRDASEWALLQSNQTQDTLQYWIADTTVMAIDSLYLAVRYMATDTTDALSWKSDTLKFFYKEPKLNKKDKKKTEGSDTLPPPIKYVNLSVDTRQQQEVYQPVIFKADEPIDTIDESMVRLEVQQDTLWLPVKDVRLAVDTLSPLLRRKLYTRWEPGGKYRLTVDSAAVTTIYGIWNNEFKHEFQVKSEEDYSNLIFNMSGVDTVPMVVELLNKSDEVIRVAPVIKGQATIKWIDPGTYYARMYLDANANGKWDTGVIDSIQPEEVAYYPKKINLKKNWDVTVDWDIYSTAIDAQKPYDIKKNKPKLKKGEKAPGSDDDEEEEEDEFGSGMFNNNRNNGRGNGRGGNNAFGNMPGLR